MTTVRMPLKQPRTAKAFFRSRHRPPLMIPARLDAAPLGNSFSMNRRGTVTMQYLHHPSCCGLRRRLLLIQLSLPNSHVRPDSRFPDIASWHLDLHADPDLMCRKLVAERRLQVVSRTASTNGMANAIFGRSLGVTLRFGGKAFCSAARTIRRCTLYFGATPLMVPSPRSYSQRSRL